MTLVLATVVGVLYGTGTYLMLRRSLVKLALGLALLSHGANLLIFSSAGVTRALSPILGPESDRFSARPADPLPQALILTAIVISFGVLAFALALVRRTQETLGTDDTERLGEDTP